LLISTTFLAQNIMLLAMKQGLGTIAAIQTVLYPEIIRKVLGLPGSKVILLRVAIGYPE
jgi:nitroreductase